MNNRPTPERELKAARALFSAEAEDYELEKGPKPLAKALRAFTVILRWLKAPPGKGVATVSAVDHELGKMMKTEDHHRLD